MGIFWSYITDSSPLKLSHRSRRIRDDGTVKEYLREKKQGLDGRKDLKYDVPNVLTDATSTQSLCLQRTESDIEQKIYYQCLVSNLNYSQIEALCLCKHNTLRYRHKVPSLMLNSELSKLAEDWALELAKLKVIQETPYAEYGENMCFSEKRDIAIDTIVQHWYDEIDFYDFSNPRFSEDTGHFTQIIWRNTKEIGVGVAQSEHGAFVVILYCPPGNFDDHFYENVPPPLRNKCAVNMYYDNQL